MDKIRRDLLSEFSKEELLGIAKELELEVSPKHRAPAIIDTIIEDLNGNGVPDPEECSDLMYEFLSAAEVIDEDGNIMDQAIDESSEETKKKGGNEPSEEPDCFGMADERDPACRRCRLMEKCLQERVACRPECFGLLFDKSSEECGVCIEANDCRESKESK